MGKDAVRFIVGGGILIGGLLWLTKRAKPSAVVEGYSNSGCLPGTESGGRLITPLCGKQAIEVRPEGDRIHITHRNATYNCCPDDIRVYIKGVEPDRYVLTVREVEVLTVPCNCLCCYLVDSIVRVPAAFIERGLFELEYCWNDWETRGIRYDKQMVQLG